MCLLYFYCQQMQRLPGLASSRLMEDTLSGRNDLIDFDDIFNGKVYLMNPGAAIVS